MADAHVRLTDERSGAVLAESTGPAVPAIREIAEELVALVQSTEARVVRLVVEVHRGA